MDTKYAEIVLEPGQALALPGKVDEELEVPAGAVAPRSATLDPLRPGFSLGTRRAIAASRRSTVAAAAHAADRTMHDVGVVEGATGIVGRKF